METEIVLTGIFIVVLVILATAKSALDELSDVSLRLLVSDQENAGHAAFWQSILEHHHQFSFTLTFGLHFAIAAIAISLSGLAHHLSQRFFLAIAFGAMLVTVLLFRQVIPLLLTQNNPERVLLALRVPLRLLWYTLGVVTWPIYRTLRRLKKAELPTTEEDQTAEESENEIQALLDVAEDEGIIIEEQEGEMIQSIMRLGDRTVGEVMTPRPNVKAIAGSATLEHVRDLMVESKYSRLPVFREDLDGIFGVIYVRDLLSHWATGDLNVRAGSIARRSLFEVPESKPVDDLLKEMQRAKAQMAMVINEYGGLAGLVTLEDLLEEIVGEIEDEDEPDPLAAEIDIVPQPDGSCLVRGHVEIGKIEREFDVELAADDFTTVAGLVINQLGHIPQVGETLEFQGLRFTVREADERRVSRLHIQSLAEQAAALETESKRLTPVPTGNS